MGYPVGVPVGAPVGAEETGAVDGTAEGTPVGYNVGVDVGRREGGLVGVRDLDIACVEKDNKSWIITLSWDFDPAISVVTSP